jgi:acylphosphatase
MCRRTLHFSGRVQGVGFRYTVRNLAVQFDVRGYVKNLNDGRVELVMEGPEPEMDRLASAVSQKMNYYISKVDLKEYPATGEFDLFHIRH